MQIHHVTINTNNGEVTYTLKLNYKRMRNIVFRLDEEESNTFKVSLPFGTRLSEIEQLFLKSYPKLVRLAKKVNKVPFTDKTYVFGTYLSLNEIQNSYNLKTIPTSLEEFYKVMKKPLIAFLKDQVTIYEKRMNVPPIYKVRIRKMKTRWGTNSKKTFTLTFNERLIHFHPLIIEALVVHELAHYFIGGHGIKFYKYLESIMPGYKHYDKMLKEYRYDANY